MRISVALLIVFLLAACGGGTNQPANTEPAANTGDSSGFGDEHGKTTLITEKAVGGGYTIKLSSVQSQLKSEAVYEVALRKDDEVVSDADVTIWLGDDTGFELAPVRPCIWMDDAKAYDCHVMLPPDGAPAGAKLWIRVRHGEFDSKKTEFPFTQ